MNPVHRGIPLAIAILLAGAATAASAQSSKGTAGDYPNRPVRLIVSSAPGGSSDGAARVIGVRLTEKWGQQVVIDNRGGAGGILGTGMVANADPDGYTLGFVSLRHAVNPSLLKVPFDSVKDFEPVSMTAAVGNVLVVNAKSPVQSVKDMIALAKSSPPGQLTFASSGIGGAPHLTGEFFAQQTGIKLTHIAYKGGGPAIADLVAGNVTMSFASMTSALPHIKSGRLRPLAVSSKERSAQLPEVPTMIEAGIGNLYVRDWQGMLAPKGTPKAIVDKLANAVRDILKDPDTATRFTAMGLDIIASTPDEFTKEIQNDVKRWAQVIKDANIKAN
jgi:tripartite-type tricarboxylate transporter receptor subunit TctC